MNRVYCLQLAFRNFWKNHMFTNCSTSKGEFRYRKSDGIITNIVIMHLSLIEVVYHVLLNGLGSIHERPCTDNLYRNKLEFLSCKCKEWQKGFLRLPEIKKWVNLLSARSFDVYPNQNHEWWSIIFRALRVKSSKINFPTLYHFNLTLLISNLHSESIPSK